MWFSNAFSKVLQIVQMARPGRHKAGYLEKPCALIPDHLYPRSMLFPVKCLSGIFFLRDYMAWFFLFCFVLGFFCKRNKSLLWSLTCFVAVALMDFIFLSLDQAVWSHSCYLNPVLYCCLHGCFVQALGSASHQGLGTIELFFHGTV